MHTLIWINTVHKYPTWTFCHGSQIESETHFVVTCNFYTRIRSDIFSEIIDTEAFLQLSLNNKLCYLNHVRKVATFIVEAYVVGRRALYPQMWLLFIFNIQATFDSIMVGIFFKAYYEQWKLLVICKFCSLLKKVFKLSMMYYNVHNVYVYAFVFLIRTV